MKFQNLRKQSSRTKSTKVSIGSLSRCHDHFLLLKSALSHSELKELACLVI
jgi:hypothetical protein